MSTSANPPAFRSRVSIIFRVILAFSLIGLTSILAILCCFFLIPWRVQRIRLGNCYGKVVGSIVFILAGIKPVITDKTALSDDIMDGKKRLDSMGPVLVVCNHCSTIDMWVGMWLNPIGGCGIAKKEIMKIPFFGFIYWLTGHLLIDRSDLQRSIESMAEVGDFVRKNKLGVWMWPEGSRSHNGQIKRFKKGFVHMALATGLPVLPIITHDADLMWPRDSFKIRPGVMEMEVLPPIDTRHWRADTATEHAAEVRAVLRAALRERQRGKS